MRKGVKNYKDKQHITEIENTLSLFNSKTCDIEKFKEYIKEKFKMENKRKGCINRDKNGCKNIQKVFNHYIETGQRPEKYKRDYKFQ